MSRSHHPRVNLYLNSDSEESLPSPSSEDSSEDEDEVNRRMKPFWPKYQSVFRLRGLQLETVKDVKTFYRQRSQTFDLDSLTCCDLGDDDALCPDAGFPDNLFRGFRISDSKRIVVKAVHSGSHEYRIVCTLSRPPLRDDHMNHTIPILDLFELHEEKVAFICMEEWSSQLIASSGPCCLAGFLSALRQCIEHAAFMHGNQIAHLDISLMNIVTDYQGHYAYIDYELSRRFKSSTPLIYNYRGTEVPPECDKGIGVDPYKVDIWALGILILRACKITGYWVPDLMRVVKPMLDEEPDRRPTSPCCLQEFDNVTLTLGFELHTITCMVPH